MAGDRKRIGIWIDTDLALGARRGDVDDGWALAAVLRSPDAEVLGVSSVFGNTRGETATRCVRELLRAAGREDVPVIDGARHAGAQSEAARAIARVPAGTRILALGPLTNVAAALALDPSLAKRAGARLVGGNFSSWGRWAPYWPFEFNLAKDAGAARAVFASPIPKRLFPLDVVHRLRLDARWLRRAARRGGSLARHLARGSWRWLAYAPLRYRALSFPIWDAVAALDAVDAIDARFVTRHLRIAGRGGLAPDDSAPATECLVDFDAAGARAALDRLVVESPR